MGTVTQLRRRIESFKLRVDKMLHSGRSAVPPHEIGVAITTPETTVDTVLQHRAAAQALLEGTARPPAPSKDAPTKAQLRNALGTSAQRRYSVPTTRSSFFSEHFAMSITTTGYGHGVAWDVPNTRHSLQPEPSRYILFPDPENGSTSSGMFAAKVARRKSRMKHSVVDPSLGGVGYNSLDEQDEQYWEQVLDLIRILSESGSLDLSHLIAAGVPISDPQLKVALCAALESSPGEALRLIEAIDAHHDSLSEENQPQIMSPLRRARESLQFTAKKARKSLFLPRKKSWRDSQYRSSVWSRVSSRMSFVSARFEK